MGQTQPQTVEQDNQVEETNPENPSNLSHGDDMIASCLMKFTMIEGKEYTNEINIQLSQLPLMRQNMMKSFENLKPEAILSIDGSRNSSIDFTILPLRNIIFFELIVKEIRKKS